MAYAHAYARARAHLHNSEQIGIGNLVPKLSVERATLCSQRRIYGGFGLPAIRQSTVTERRDASPTTVLTYTHPPRACPFLSCRSLEGVRRGLCALVNLSNYPLPRAFVPSSIQYHVRIASPSSPSASSLSNPRSHPLRTASPLPVR